MGEKSKIFRIFVLKHKRGHLKDLGVDMGIILKIILNEYDENF